MAWLVELANTDHPAELNIGTVCLVCIFSYYVWAIFVQTVLQFYTGNCEFKSLGCILQLYPDVFFLFQFTWTLLPTLP